MGQIADLALSLKEAIARQMETYDAFVYFWGTNTAPWNLPTAIGLDSYPYLNQPGIPDSIAGVAIGPESDVDRAWITTNVSKDLATAAGDVTLLTREISVEQPLLFTQPAKIDRSLVSLLAPTLPSDTYEAQRRSLMYVFAKRATAGYGPRTSSTEIPPTYIRLDGTVADFFPNPLDGINFNLTPPILHLRFFLQPGVPMQTKRSQRLFGITNPAETKAVGADTTVAMWPMFGRKHVEVMLRTDTMTPNTGQVQFRVTKLRTLTRGATQVQEELIGSKIVTANANGEASTSFSFCNPGASYLILYANTVVGTARLRQYSATMED